jgi:hypothetical protein
MNGSYDFRESIAASTIEAEAPDQYGTNRTTAQASARG